MESLIFLQVCLNASFASIRQNHSNKILFKDLSHYTTLDVKGIELWICFLLFIGSS